MLSESPCFSLGYFQLLRLFNSCYSFCLPRSVWLGQPYTSVCRYGETYSITWEVMELLSELEKESLMAKGSNITAVITKSANPLSLNHSCDHKISRHHP